MIIQFSNQPRKKRKKIPSEIKTVGGVLLLATILSVFGRDKKNDKQEKHNDINKEQPTKTIEPRKNQGFTSYEDYISGKNEDTNNTSHVTTYEDYEREDKSIEGYELDLDENYESDMKRFDAFIKDVLIEEGTKPYWEGKEYSVRGIKQSTLNTFHKKYGTLGIGLPKNVKSLTEKNAKKIYYHAYYRRNKFHMIKDNPISKQLLDIKINGGYPSVWLVDIMNKYSNKNIKTPKKGSILTNDIIAQLNQMTKDKSLAKKINNDLVKKRLQYLKSLKNTPKVHQVWTRRANKFLISQNKKLEKIKANKERTLFARQQKTFVTTPEMFYQLALEKNNRRA